MPVHLFESSFVISAQELAGAPPDDAPEVCFLGRSNVGKSSMINAILGRRKLARVSNTPGRTRLLNFFKVTVDAGEGKRDLSICDLPGYGYAKVPRSEAARWQPMIERYLEGRKSLAGAVVLLDSRHEPSDADRGVVDWLRQKGRPVLIVATKIDKLSKANRFAALRIIDRGLGLPDGSALAFSAPRRNLWAVWG